MCVVPLPIGDLGLVILTGCISTQREARFSRIGSECMSAHCDLDPRAAATPPPEHPPAVLGVLVWKGGHHLTYFLCGNETTFPVQVMATNLMTLEGKQTTVAVVGLAHVDGIERILAANGWKPQRC